METLRERQITKIIGELLGEANEHGSAVWQGGQTGRMAIALEDVPAIEAAVAKIPGLQMLRQLHDVGGTQRTSWIVVAPTVAKAWARHTIVADRFLRAMISDPAVNARALVQGTVADLEALRRELQGRSMVDLTPFQFEG